MDKSHLVNPEEKSAQIESKVPTPQYEAGKYPRIFWNDFCLRAFMPLRVSDPADLIDFILPRQRIFVHGGASTPQLLLQELSHQHARHSQTEILHLHTYGKAEYASFDEFKVTNLFVGQNLRDRLDYDRVDYLPCLLSEIPFLFRRGIRTPDIAVIQVSPPDKNGLCSLGVSVDIAKAAVDCAKIVLAQINKYQPRTHGDGMIPFSRIQAFWEFHQPLAQQVPAVASSIDHKIASHIATLVEDGSTIQVGIGAIPNAVLPQLANHRRLGLHTEMFSDGILPLLKCGAVDNSQKKHHRGKSVTSFVIGSDELYRYVDDNPSVLFLSSDYVNDANTIARNPRTVAINSAVEIDLSGQIVADSIGSRVISGAGGQLDFFRGAQQSEGGKAIIALPSRTHFGKPRIVSSISNGAGVVTPRSCAHFIVTEFGVANLYGKTIGERANALIGIAHPADRENLSRNFAETHARR